jgi:hypothetical protein
MRWTRGWETHRNTRQRESHGKGLDIGRELLEGLAGLSLTLGDGGNKVLEELGSGLGLSLELWTGREVSDECEGKTREGGDVQQSGRRGARSWRQPPCRPPSWTSR